MTPDRIDQLLDHALRTGEIPAQATADERAEVERLLAGATNLRLNASRVEGEARDSMPAARARFQRHLAAQRPAAPVAVAKSKPGFFSRLSTGRSMALATSFGTLAVIAVLAVVVLRPFSSTETASALTVDDYVQVQGVVSTASDAVVNVESPELGDLEIAVTDVTAVSDGEATIGASNLKPGDQVVISGVVTNRRTISASNVVVARNQELPAPVGNGRIPLLKKLRDGLEGRMTLITLSPDGQRARVLIVTANSRFLVDVEPSFMDQFLAENPGTLGAQVRVVGSPGSPASVFRLERVQGVRPPGEPSPPPAANTPVTGASGGQFDNIRGLVTGKDANVLTVQTDRGPIAVVVRPATVIRVGESDIGAQDIRDGNRVIGLEVSISGHAEVGKTGRVIASLLIVIGRPQR